MSKNLIEAIRTKAEWKEIFWDDVPSTSRNIGSTLFPDYRDFVEEEDILNFVNSKIKEFARIFNCESEAFKELVYKENKEFFDKIKGLYSRYYDDYQKGCSDLNSAYKLFKMPSIEGFSYAETDIGAFSEVTTEQVSAIFTTIIEQMVPKDKQEEFKKYFNI